MLSSTTVGQVKMDGVQVSRYLMYAMLCCAVLHNATMCGQRGIYSGKGIARPCHASSLPCLKEEEEEKGVGVECVSLVLAAHRNNNRSFLALNCVYTFFFPPLCRRGLLLLTRVSVYERLLPRALGRQASLHIAGHGTRGIMLIRVSSTPAVTFLG